MLREFKIKGLEKIKVKRGAQGVPMVRAAVEEDLYRALGYCHALDRGMQMLATRVLAQGRACELLRDSPEMLQTDLFFRRLGLHIHLEREVTALEPEERRLLRAYCDGANQILKHHIPWELRSVGYKPAPWRPADCILLARVTGYVSLAQSQGDLERLVVQMVREGVPRPLLEALFPGRLEGLEEALLRDLKETRQPVPDEVRWSGLVPRVMASNNWAVSGARTSSGAAMLASDPHLEISRLPAIWYEFQGQWTHRYIIAATMPGLPAFLMGRSPELSWGATYAFADAEDSWIEDCRDGCYRRHIEGEDRWFSFRQRREVIGRKKHPDMEVVFYENEHGVLEGDPFQEPGLRLSTRWAGAQAGVRSIRAAIDILRARSVPEGMDALGKLEVAFSWVLADAKGQIGMQMSGAVPLRREGASGLVPLPGWDPANDWLGLASPEQLPRQLNPECGFVVTANNDLNHLGQLGPLAPSNAEMGPWRARRIQQVLSSREDLDVEAMRRLQLDLVSLHALDWMELVRPLLPETPQGRLLATWDGRYTLHSRGAYLFEVFYEALLDRVFGGQWGQAVQSFLKGETATFVDFYHFFDAVLMQPSSPWFGEHGRDEILTEVLEEALNCRIQPWSTRRDLTLRHLLLGDKLPAQAGFDVGPIKLPGGRATVQQGQIYRSGGRDTSFAPSWRLITDMSQDSAHTGLPGGASDRRFSRWYTASLDLWLRGRLVERQGRW